MGVDSGYIYYDPPRHPPAKYYPTSDYLGIPDYRAYNEWLDSPTQSPSKHPVYMSSTAIATRLETPSKTKVSPASLSYITPTSQKTDAILRTITPEPHQADFHHTVKSWDVFWAMLNDITGKDKMAKVGQYTLRLLLHHADNAQTYLSDTSINIDTINRRYNNHEKKLNLLRNFARHPQNFIRIIVILLCSTLLSKLAGMVGGLSTYRQFLRFGKSPFRIRSLLLKLRENIHWKQGADLVPLLTVNRRLWSRKTLLEVFGLYYGLNDESLLLFKLKFFLSKPLRRFVARHESLAWYYDTWLNLYNAVEKLQTLQQEEIDVKILIQVKNKARVLLRQLLSGNGQVLHSNHSSTSTSVENCAVLNDIQFKKNNAYLDIYKNISDLVFNSYTVFRLALPFDTLQIWMGISASVLATIKVYRETKHKLIEEERVRAEQ